jgi:hypothetical protein
MATPILGIGGSVSIPDARVTSFREWEHFHNPIDPFPHHRFWTWGIMNATADSDAGKCAYGIVTSKEDIDIRFECDKPIIEEKIKQFPDLHWHGIGNEPNWGPRLEPFDYAYQFKLYRDYILSLDAEAKMMLGGVTLPVPWVDWLSELFSYGIEIDIYDIHPYPKYEMWQTSANYIVDFRSFVNNNKPIVLGEFSVLGGSIASNLDYMRGLGNWLHFNYETYNVIGWYWWIGTDLVDNGKLTELGKTYIECFGPRKDIYLPIIMK